jgi:hypothetical protein
VPEWLRKLLGIQTAVQTGRNDPVLQAAVEKSALIYRQIPLREFIDEKTRVTLSRQLFLMMSEVSRSIDPLTAGREKLTTLMLEFAAYQVLVIPPEPESDLSALRGKAGISGEMKEHYFELATGSDEICGQLRDVDQPLTAEVVWDEVQQSYWTRYWFLESINAVRLEIGDCPEGGDWFGPYKHAACAHREHLYRKDLDLPPGFDAVSAETIATAYSILTDIILSGAADPLGEWRDYYKDSNIPCPG